MLHRIQIWRYDSIRSKKMILNKHSSILMNSLPTSVVGSHWELILDALAASPCDKPFSIHLNACHLNESSKNAVQARKKLVDVYGERVLTVHLCQNLFPKFRSCISDVEDAPLFGRPVEADKDTIKLLMDNRTINFEMCCQQLDKLNDSQTKSINRRGVVFHQDNSHTSWVSCQMGYIATPAIFSISGTL
ncbi:histone-lysine N-methyltransferase SETMAR [Trichonephila clavipes]|nr:histone-lysine N-methyltransferase SETMAR [Trichonephila clavipes]